jgi:predicted nucleic acid-binding protein
LTIVSNTSPLIALDHLGDLDLIPKVLGSGLLIPPAVAVLTLPIIGTLGLLLKAKQLGLIQEIRPELIALRTLPFHIAPKLYTAVLKDAGE